MARLLLLIENWSYSNKASVWDKVKWLATYNILLLSQVWITDVAQQFVKHSKRESNRRRIIYLVDFWKLPKQSRIDSFINKASFLHSILFLVVYEVLKHNIFDKGLHSLSIYYFSSTVAWIICPDDQVKTKRDSTVAFIYPKSGLIVYLHRLILLLFLNLFRQFATHVQNIDFYVQHSILSMFCWTPMPYSFIIFTAYIRDWVQDNIALKDPCPFQTFHRPLIYIASVTPLNWYLKMCFLVRNFSQTIAILSKKIKMAWFPLPSFTKVTRLPTAKWWTILASSTFKFLVQLILFL